MNAKQINILLTILLSLFSLVNPVSILAEEVVLKINPSFESGAEKHTILRTKTFLIAGYSDKSTRSLKDGQIHQSPIVYSLGGGFAVLEFQDFFKGPFTVPKTGYYKISFKGSFGGFPLNVGLDASPAKYIPTQAGALTIEILAYSYNSDGQIFSGPIYEIIDKPPWPYYFPESDADEANSIVDMIKDGISADLIRDEIVYYIGLQALWVPEIDKFDISHYRYIEAGEINDWAFLMGTHMSSGSILAGHVNLYDLTVNLEEIEIKLIEGDATAIDIENLTLTPNTVDPYEDFEVSGRATYDNGTVVKTGTAYISVEDGNDYTTPVTNGQFSTTVKAPDNNSSSNIMKNVNVVVEDGIVTKGQDSATLTILGRGVTGPITISEAIMYSDASNSRPDIKIDVFGRIIQDIACWVQLEHVPPSGCKIEWRWKDPNNNPIRRRNKTVAPAEGQSVLTTWDHLKDESWYDLEGQWTVQIWVDDVHLMDVPFYMRYVQRQHVMCKDVQNADPCEPIGETNTFYQTDEKAVTWCQLDMVPQPLEVMWKAYEPNGALFETWYYTTKDPKDEYKDYYGWFRLHGTMYIKGTNAVNKCGKWQVKLYIQNYSGNWEYKYTDYFRILEDPPENPQVSVIASPDVPTALQSPTFVISATDNTYLSNVTIYLNIEGELYQESLGDSLNVASFDHTYYHVPLAEDQRVEYWATATDTSGNVSESMHRSFIVLPPGSNLSVITENLEVESASATLHGLIEEDEGFPCYCGFVWREAQGVLGYKMPWIYAWDREGLPVVSPRKEFRSGDDFSVSLVLAPNKTYEFAPVVENTAGYTMMGAIDTFTTLKWDPHVVTENVLFIEGTVRLAGFIVHDGENPCRCGFWYGKIEEPETAWTYVECPGWYRSGEYFFAFIDGLEEYNSYGFYAVAENVAGCLGTGETLYFTSDGILGPTVRTDSADIVDQTASFYGSLLDDGGEACETRFVIEIDNSGELITTDWIDGYTSGEEFSDSLDISGLISSDETLEISYYAEAKNSAGLGRGSKKTILFSPENHPPVWGEGVPDTISVDERSLLVFTVEANDLDGDPLTYWTGNLPDGATFDPDTRTFSWTPSYEQSGEYYVDFYVSDGKVEVPKTIRITVSNFVQAPTVETGLAELTDYYLCIEMSGMLIDDGGQACEIRFVINDWATWTTEWVGPFTSGEEFSMYVGHRDLYNEVGITLPFMSLDISYYTEARNDAGVSQGYEETGVIISKNYAPMFNLKLHYHTYIQVTSGGSLLVFTAADAFDPDGDPITYWAGNLPDGATFDPDTRTFSWTPSYEQSGVYLVDICAGDGEDESSVTYRIYVDVPVEPVE